MLIVLAQNHCSVRPVDAYFADSASVDFEGEEYAQSEKDAEHCWPQHQMKHIVLVEFYRAYHFFVSVWVVKAVEGPLVSCPLGTVRFDLVLVENRITFAVRDEGALE